MSKFSPSTGQPGASRGSVEATGHEAPPHTVSAEQVLQVMRQLTSYAYTLRQLIEAAHDSDELELSSQLEAAAAMAANVGMLADATVHALGEPGLYHDALSWQMAGMRAPLAQLRQAHSPLQVARLAPLGVPAPSDQAGPGATEAAPPWPKRNATAKRAARAILATVKAPA